MRAAIPEGVRPLSEVRFDFSADGIRMGLPAVYVHGVNIDAFALPVYVCDDDQICERSWAYGYELGLISLAWHRKFHICDGALDAAIKVAPAEELPHFVRTLRVHSVHGQWREGVYDAFFGVYEEAINHAVTARGDVERDCMVPSELDLLTPQLAESRLRKVLSGERVPSLAFRASASA
jgi:hypothetical protein